MALDRTWYNALVDDDGSNTVGSIWNKAAVDSLMDTVDAEIVRLDAVDAAAVTGTSAPTTTGTQTALAIPSGTGPLVIYANNASLLTVQGITAGLQGQRLTMFSKGAGQIDFAHLHASGTALGKLKLFATSGLASLAAGVGVAVFVYDATVTQWRLVAHEQGAWITPTYAAGGFTASANAWTVDAGDVTSLRYLLRGRTLTMSFTLSTTTVTGAAAELRIQNTMYGGFTGAGVVYNPAALGFQGATVYPTQLLMNATTFLTLKKTDTTNWGADTNGTYMYGEITFDVT